MTEPRLQFGVSYFGVRNPPHVQRDLDDMLRLGFDYVVFTFSEHDHRFYRETLATCVRHAHQRGLKVYIDPWGVCGIFAGEAFTERGAWDLEGQQRRSDGRPLPLLCPNSVEVRTYLRQWIGTVAEVLHADAIFWDEPHFYLPYGTSQTQGLWGCCCRRCQERFLVTYQAPLPDRETAEVRQCKQEAIADLLQDMTAVATASGLQNVVCVLPEHEHPDILQTKFDRFASNPHLAVLSTDPYPLIHGRDIATTQRLCEALRRACQQHGKATQMWLQGFRVAAGQEPLLGEEMWLMVNHGIRDLAIWSYLATAYMSSHTCADSDRVWAVFTQTMQELRRGESRGQTPTD
ncbi:hypothetical protein NKDENANG_03246 [Candidatus Entotheonellaceae bacterium PAL068K]